MSALQRVPQDMSFHFETVENWKAITRQILEGDGFTSSAWARVDRLLIEGTAQLKNRQLSLEHDWETDLTLANEYHQTNVRWAEGVVAQLNGMARAWEVSAEKGMDFSFQILTHSMKFLSLSHGAIGLACLAALSQSNKAVPEWLFASTILAAVLGIAMLALGSSIMLEVLPAGMSHVRDRLNSLHSFKKFKRLGRVWDRKISPKLQLSNYFIYASLIWLLFYATAAMITLVSV